MWPFEAGIILCESVCGVARLSLDFWINLSVWVLYITAEGVEVLNIWGKELVLRRVLFSLESSGLFIDVLQACFQF